jgi:Platelet-activating factor acetylhydrolase, isoform II
MFQELTVQFLVKTQYNRSGPILITVWYPAKTGNYKSKMKQENYFDLETAKTEFKDISRHYKRYTIETFIREIFREPASKISSSNATLLSKILKIETLCARETPAAIGKFPVVIYHQGHGATFEDNSVLCEFLASHGFLVVGGSFLHEDGSALSVDSRQGSIRDVGFLLNEISKLPNADINKVGHSRPQRWSASLYGQSSKSFKYPGNCKLRDNSRTIQC